LYKKADYYRQENIELKNRLDITCDGSNDLEEPRNNLIEMEAAMNGYVAPNKAVVVPDSVLSPDESSDDNEVQIDDSIKSSFSIEKSPLLCVVNNKDEKKFIDSVKDVSVECVSPKPAVLWAHGEPSKLPQQQGIGTSQQIHSKDTRKLSIILPHPTKLTTSLVTCSIKLKPLKQTIKTSAICGKETVMDKEKIKASKALDLSIK